jgi:hypothetical protein
MFERSRRVEEWTQRTSYIYATQLDVLLDSGMGRPLAELSFPNEDGTAYMGVQ